MLFGVFLVFSACSKSSESSASSASSPSPASSASPRPPFRATAYAIGNSMLPAFATFEVVQLELCSFSDLGSGDTVIYWHDSARQYIHHRLDGRDHTGRWVTRGDNNPNVDRGHMTSDEFIGRTHKL